MNCFHKLLYVLIAALLISACTRKSAPLTSSMETEGVHHKWKVVAAEGMGNADSIFLDLRDVQRSGATAGCQYFSFTPKFGHHNRMEIANVSGHLVACEGDQRDRQLMGNLRAVYSFSVVGDQLKLLGKNGHTVFSARKATDDEDGSIARRWLIQQMINADNDQLIKAGSFLDLSNLAAAKGTTGCNNFSFTVVADDTYHIVLNRIAATEKYCQGGMSNETVFSRVLPLVSKYQVIGDRLKLFDKDNVLLLEGKATQP